ncbi:hypothetical protein G8C92_25875 [Paenibacillus donghaensis]|uniref:hypothetical protein n=1 Tax=Paenibacillus donghaensis TaxID=414771 RepID=UPI001883F92A|nr:hypothetical protein [Paenibacillus donghaensis]MBE9917446.1 hypothetical protein [Paenibacillus donghaensis]
MVEKLSESSIFMLIKFSNSSQHLRHLQTGKLFMNNGNYFIEREKLDRSKGIGDKYELSQVVNDVNLKFYESGTDKFLFDSKASKLSLRYNHLLTKPIFCLTHVSAASLKIINEYDDYVDCHFNFDSEQLERDFGEYALLISPGAFQERIEAACKEQGIEYIADKIMYEDYSINSRKRLEAYIETNPEIFFKKDLSFEHQHEYRIVFTNVDKQEAFIFDIGDLSEISHLIKTKDLCNGKFGLKLYF